MFRFLKKRKSQKNFYSKEELVNKLEKQGFQIKRKSENVEVLIKDDGISVEKISINLNNQTIKYKQLTKQRGNKRDNSMNQKTTVISFDILSLLNNYIECVKNEVLQDK